MTFYYQPMREYRKPGQRRGEVRVCKPGDEPETHSVYLHTFENFSEWVADFACKEHATEFIAKMNGHDRHLLRLPRVGENRRYALGKHFISLCTLHDICYLTERDVEVEFFEKWEFVKVTVFRWCDAGPGCGTRHTRDLKWQQTYAAIRDAFDLYMTPQSSWRHVDLGTRGYDHEKPYDFLTNGVGTIPGVTFCIRKEKA